MLMGFWDPQDPILEHCQERSTIINSAHYSAMLTGRLKPVIHRKCQGLLSEGVVLYDNAHPHTAAHTAYNIWKLKFDVMAHPPYSPDLTLSD
jgi:hypothetical protein